MSPAELLELVSSEIDRLSAVQLRNLAFPATLEYKFEDDTRVLRCQRLWFEGVLAIVLFDTYLFADGYISGDRGLNAVLVRLLLITPLALAVNASMRFDPPPFLREASVALVACAAGGTELLLEANRCAVRSAYAQFAVTAVLVFSNTVMRLRLAYALVASIIIVVLDAAFLSHDAYLSPDQKWVGAFLTMCTLMLSILANYSQNREERLGYLMSQRNDLMLEKTRELNSRLAHVAETDALTGIANRNAFNRTINELWREARLQLCHLSIIVMDVDHFKAINDNFGHIYGDVVLRTVAHTLRQGLRSSSDFLARFGGEEFVIYLPDTMLQEACDVAERLRCMVAEAVLPQPTDAQPDWPIRTTISCGVASGLSSDLPNPELLLDLADKALYRAKSQGRNVVCTDVHGSPPARETQPRGSEQPASDCLNLDPALSAS